MEPQPLPTQAASPSKASEEEMLLHAIRRLNSRILGGVLGVVCGLVLFIATNWLVLLGGDPVGPHLALLSNYFIGYSVTFAGSFVGLAYGLVVGFMTGWLIAILYNWMAGKKAT